MKKMNILSYIKKYRAMIVLVSIVMGALFVLFFDRRQTYTAQAVIRYTNEEAVTGLAPDGTEIDTSEIYSSEVMTRVFRELNLSYDENNMDEIRSGVEVKAILNEQEEAVQTALTEQGELPADKPTTYRVSYTVKKHDVADAETFASQILNTMLKVYMETYAEQHVNKSDIPNTVSGVYDGDYDYIEMAEVLENSVESTTQELLKKVEIPFRSSQTGYSFRDIRREFEMIQDIDISKVYAYVLDNTVTKDQDVLLSKYQNRIENTRLTNNAAQAEVDGVQEIINSYVKMMRESGNVNYTFEYILDEVYDNYYTIAGTGLEGDKRKNADIVTEYDTLMNKYVKERTDFDRALVEIAYNQYILSVYSGNSDSSAGITVQLVAPDAAGEGAETTGAEEGNTAASAGETTVETAGASNEAGAVTVVNDETGSITFESGVGPVKTIVSSEEVQNTAYQMVKELAQRINSLHEVLRVTNQEYNQYAGAENVSVATDVVVKAGMNIRLYAIMAVILFGMIGCVLAVVIGRLMDIFDFYVYVDKKLGVANRAGCDRYIRSFTKLVPSGMICMAAKVTEIESKNKVYGREACDGMIKNFCEILRSVLPEDRAFIASNTVGQFVIFIESADKDYARACIREVRKRCINYNQSNSCKISFSCGISSSDSDDIYDIRRLMIDALGKAVDDNDRKDSVKTA